MWSRSWWQHYLPGNEFAIGAFIHPVLSRLDTGTHVRSVQAIGRRYGSVMPFWMVGLLLLEVTLLFEAGPRWQGAWTWAAVLGRVAVGRAGLQRGRASADQYSSDEMGPGAVARGMGKGPCAWDKMHAVRVIILIASLAALVISAMDWV